MGRAESVEVHPKAYEELERIENQIQAIEVKDDHNAFAIEDCRDSLRDLIFWIKENIIYKR
jgi:hypothetical protein